MVQVNFIENLLNVAKINIYIYILLSCYNTNYTGINTLTFNSPHTHCTQEIILSGHNIEK